MKSPFRYCPVCRSANNNFDGLKRFNCYDCGFEYYHNTAAAVAAFLEYEGHILTIERNRNPGKGMLDLPGGFCDYTESAEESLYRELKEEINATIVRLEYMFSFPNRYSYKGITYFTVDLFYYGKLESNDFDIEEEEISKLLFFKPADLNPDDFSFESMKKAISKFKNIKMELS